MSSEVDILEQQLRALEETVMTMASWLVDAQTGFGEQDYKGIVEMIDKARKQSHMAHTDANE